MRNIFNKQLLYLKELRELTDVAKENRVDKEREIE